MSENFYDPAGWSRDVEEWSREVQRRDVTSTERNNGMANDASLESRFPLEDCAKTWLQHESSDGASEQHESASESFYNPEYRERSEVTSTERKNETEKNASLASGLSLVDCPKTCFQKGNSNLALGHGSLSPGESRFLLNLTTRERRDGETNSLLLINMVRIDVAVVEHFRYHVKGISRIIIYHDVIEVECTLMKKLCRRRLSSHRRKKENRASFFCLYYKRREI